MSKEMTEQKALPSNEVRIDTSHGWVMSALIAFVLFVTATAFSFLNGYTASSETREWLSPAVALAALLSFLSGFLFFHKLLRHIELVIKLNKNSK